MSRDKNQLDLHWQAIDGFIHIVISGNDSVSLEGIDTELAERFSEMLRESFSAEPRPAILGLGMVVALNNLAVLHCQQEKFAEAEAEFKQVCLQSRFYAQSQPEIFLPLIADSLNSLGLLYQFKENYTRAEIALTGAANTYEVAQTFSVDSGQVGFSYGTALDWFQRVNRVFTQGPDKFFDKEKISRLEELMKNWRKARDESRELPKNMQDELDQLIDEELEATIARLEAKENLIGK